MCLLELEMVFGCDYCKIKYLKENFLKSDIPSQVFLIHFSILNCVCKVK